MRQIWWFGCVAVLVLATTAYGQSPPSLGDSTAAPELSSMSENMTPEMWLYAQESKRREDPKVAVRRKAEFRAAQRQRRLESQRWFGFINLRPPANPVPFYGSYSPAWRGNSSDGYGWHGTGMPYVTYHTVTR